MMRAASSFVGGVWAVCLAPALVGGVLLVTLASALPFGVVLGSRLQAGLANEPLLPAHADEIDPEWWAEFRAQATGLEATFTPTVIGFAAPLDNLSALLDGERRPLALAGPVVVAGLCWAFLWGGILHRFRGGRRLPLREFLAACLLHLPRFALISLAAALLYPVLYATVHAWMFGPLYGWLSSAAASERDAFLWRVALYAAFGTLLATVSLVADYARVSVVAAEAPSSLGALQAGARFVRGHAAGVVTLYLLTGALFGVLLVAYGYAESVGGSRLAGWRGVLAGQVYIIARLSLRLVLAASEVRFFVRSSEAAARS